MDTILSYDQWKEQNIKIDDDMVDQFKVLHNISEDKFVNEIENICKQEYELYVLGITDPDQFIQLTQNNKV
jgi:hypothetical protein